MTSGALRERVPSAAADREKRSDRANYNWRVMGRKCVSGRPIYAWLKRKMKIKGTILWCGRPPAPSLLHPLLQAISWHSIRRSLWIRLLRTAIRAPIGDEQKSRPTLAMREDNPIADFWMAWPRSDVIINVCSMWCPLRLWSVSS